MKDIFVDAGCAMYWRQTPLSLRWSEHIAGVPPLPLSIVPCQPGWACPHHTIPYHTMAMLLHSYYCTHHPPFFPHQLCLPAKGSL